MHISISLERGVLFDIHCTCTLMYIHVHSIFVKKIFLAFEQVSSIIMNFVINSTPT